MLETYPSTEQILPQPRRAGYREWIALLSAIAAQFALRNLELHQSEEE